NIVIDVTRVASLGVSYTPTQPLAFGDYHWRMQVQTGAGWSVWMPAYGFTVSPALPAAPALVSPASGFQTNNTTPTLAWNAVAKGRRLGISDHQGAHFAAAGPGGARPRRRVRLPAGPPAARRDGLLARPRP